MKTGITAALLAAVLLPSSASALQVQTLVVSRDGGVYHVVVEALIDAPPDRLREELLDTANLPRLDPSVKAVRHSEDAAGLRVETDIEDCLLGVCRQLLQVQQITAAGNEISARTLPVAGSGFKSGAAQWQWTAVGTGSRLVFTADSEPALWLPPLIGPRLLMRHIEEKTRSALQVLEQLARE